MFPLSFKLFQPWLARPWLWLKTGEKFHVVLQGGVGDLVLIRGISQLVGHMRLVLPSTPDVFCVYSTLFSLYFSFCQSTHSPTSLPPFWLRSNLYSSYSHLRPPCLGQIWVDSAFDLSFLLLGPTFFLLWSPSLGAGGWPGLFIYLFFFWGGEGNRILETSTLFKTTHKKINSTRVYVI